MVTVAVQLEPQEAEFVQDTLNLSDTERSQLLQFRKGEGLLCANNNHVLVAVKASKTEDELITTDREQLGKMAKKKLAAIT